MEKLLKKFVLLVLVIPIFGCFESPQARCTVDLRNTTWHINNKTELGEIKISESSKFCMNRVLAEKLYPKQILNDKYYYENEICGDLYQNNEVIAFNLIGYTRGVILLMNDESSVNKNCFMPIVIDGEEMFLIQ